VKSVTRKLPMGGVVTGHSAKAFAAACEEFRCVSPACVVFVGGSKDQDPGREPMVTLGICSNAAETMPFRWEIGSHPSILFHALKALVLAGVLAGAARSHGGETVLLDFNAPWCGPCRTMQPVVRRLQADGYTVREVNIDENRELAARFKVTSIPCFVMIVDGREVDRSVGATSYERLRRMLQSAQARTTPVAAPARPRPAPIPPIQPPTQPPIQPPIQPPTRRSIPAMVVSSSQAAAQPPGPPVGGLDAALLQTAVRIRVEDSTGRSFGTGTLIDLRGDQALVLTCGHLFREAQEDGKIFVELFLPSGVKTIPAHLISYDLNRDIGLLSMRPGIAVRTARVAPKDHPIAPGDRVINIGCNNGQPPTVRQTHVTAIDRYNGPPNIEAAGTPVEGRSGGGLFDQYGHLIGVCFAADGSDNEGLYAGLASIHAELDRLGLATVYAATASTAQDATATLAETPPPLPKQMPDSTIMQTAATQQISPEPGRPPVAAHAGGIAASSDPRLSEAEQAALAEIGRRSRGAEVICIVRPSDPKAKSEIFVLQNVSPEFIQKLTNAGPPKLTPRATPSAMPRLTSMSVPAENRPLAAGQTALGAGQTALGAGLPTASKPPTPITAHRVNDSRTGWRPKFAK
jgi:thiol-disulfide isomerase/thioredoxin